MLLRCLAGANAGQVLNYAYRAGMVALENGLAEHVHGAEGLEAEAPKQEAPEPFDISKPKFRKKRGRPRKRH